MTIQMTDLAKQQVLFAIEEEEAEKLALRVAVNGRGPGGFQYQMDLVDESERSADDVVFDQGEFELYVDAESAPNLDGATIDFVQRLQDSGFRFENPNSPWDDPIAAEVQRVIDEQINPQIASHGGFVTLLDVKEDTAFITMGGGCQGCGLADVTLRNGIETMILEAVPAIEKVLDTTDHAAGANPYYTG